MTAPDSQRMAELFIRCQQYRDRAWKAHIAKNELAAIAQASLLQLAATELLRKLSKGNGAD